MSTSLNEWLQKTIAELEEERDAVPGAVNEDAFMALAAMKLALASLEAEPVAWISERNLKNLGKSYSVYVKHEPVMVRPIPLYTAPPAPVVPDEKPVPNPLKMYAVDAVAAIAEVRGWNACRAAMLQGAENAESPSSNYPVIPGGWVACSERMPHIGVPVITCCGDVVQYAAYAWDGKEWQDWYEEYDKLPASTFTHWHPRPAAPQQEVK
ncbi:TPA: DUF551 domain-containing protein [Enterobacter hormaechei]